MSYSCLSHAAVPSPGVCQNWNLNLEQKEGKGSGYVTGTCLGLVSFGRLGMRDKSLMTSSVWLVLIY